MDVYMMRGGLVEAWRLVERFRLWLGRQCGGGAGWRGEVSGMEGLWRVSGLFTSLEGVEGRDGETPGLCTSVS